MIETFKDILEETFNKWSLEIKASPNGSTVIDMAEEFNEIMSRNMVTIILGEDITEEEVEINCRVSETSYSFVLKKLKLCQAIDECF